MNTEQKTFIENIAKYVKKYAPKYGISVNSPIIAQAILESGWGKSGLAKYHNYFGLKCGSKWSGKSVNMTTKEEYKVGTLTTIKDNFRVFDTLELGVKGYFDFISISRYSNLKGVTDPKKYLELIKSDGYATSSTYVSSLYEVITKYDLTKYDGGEDIMTEKELRKKYVDGIIAWKGMSRAKGTHKPIIDLYNSHKPLPRGYKVTYTDAYCATTTSAGAIKAGLTDIIPIECSCNEVINIAQKMGIWVENDAYVPNTGDLILYDWDDNGVGDDKGAPEHIGAVVSVTNKVIKVIEGNKGGNVDYREIPVNGKYIRGFVTPKYASKATKEETKEETPKPTTKKTVEQVAKEVIAGKWGTGEDRKKSLTKAGYNYTKVQEKVNELLGKKTTTLKHAVGDTVTYKGNVHYPNAGKNATGKTCKGGKAKITQISKGSAHPYHLVAVKGSGATVYGWVNAGTFN